MPGIAVRILLLRAHGLRGKRGPGIAIQSKAGLSLSQISSASETVSATSAVGTYPRDQVARSTVFAKLMGAEGMTVDKALSIAGLLEGE